MKLFTASVAITVLCLAFVPAIRIAPRSSNPRTVGVDFTRSTLGPKQVARQRSKLHKRQDVVEQSLNNLANYYTANVTLGTPPQSLQLLINTASADLWVNTPNSQLCMSEVDACIGGTYNASASSTYETISNNFNVTYADGSEVGGNYSSDRLGLGGISLEKLQFGVGEYSTSFTGSLGIGYINGEAQVGTNSLQRYPNLPLMLVNEGHTKSNSYSLWLNDPHADTGSILFGGVDRAKYRGDLVTVPTVGADLLGQYSLAAIELTGLAVDGHNLSSSSLPLSVIIDCGTTGTYLPRDIAETIYNQTNVLLTDSGEPFVECSASNSSTIVFEFRGLQIPVSLDAMILGNYSRTFSDGVKRCGFGIGAAEGFDAILGNTFLRSAYVVYDFTHNQISLAPTVFNATESDVREIDSGVFAIPPKSSTSVSATSTTTTSSQSAFSSTGTSTARPNGGGSNTGAIAGGVVGGVSGLIVIGLAFFLLRRQRRQRMQRQQPGSPIEKAQLHSDDLKPQVKELDGRNDRSEIDGKSAPHELRGDETPMAELPVNEEVGREMA